MRASPLGVLNRKGLQLEFPVPIYGWSRPQAVRPKRPHPKPPDAASTERSAAPPRRNHTPPDTLLRRRPRVSAHRTALRIGPMKRSPNLPLIKATVAALSRDTAKPIARSFAEQAAADAAPDELPELSTPDL